MYGESPDDPEEEEFLELLKDCIRDNGILYRRNFAVSWSPGEKEISLTGSFSKRELEAFIYWMDIHSEEME